MKRLAFALALFASQPALASGIFLTTHMVAPPNATAFLQYDAAQGCTLVTADKARYSFFYMALNRDGLNTGFDMLHVHGMAPDECSAYINLAKPGTYTETPNGNTQFLPYQGVQLDQTTAYLDTSVNSNAMTNFTQDNAHAGTWVSTFGAGNSDDLGTVSTGTLLANLNSGSHVRTFRLPSGANANDGPAVLGYMAEDRASSTQISTYENGAVKSAALSSNDTTLPASHVTIGRSVAVYSGDLIAEDDLGSALNSTKEGLLAADIHIALQSSGAAPPNPNAVSCGGAIPCLPSYFTGSGVGTMNATVNAGAYRIEIPFGPPASNAIDQTTYQWFPGTEFCSQDIATLNTSTYTNGHFCAFIWGDRWDGGHNQKPNPIRPAQFLSGGQQCWARYSTLANSIAANAARAAFAVGKTRAYILTNITEPAGYPDANVLYFDSTTGTPDLADNINTLCAGTTVVGTITYNVLTDYVVFPNAQMTNAQFNELIVDWEVQDGHSCAQTTTEMTNMAGYAQGAGFKFELYTNPLDGGNFTNNGFCADGSGGANLGTINGIVDYFDLGLLDSNPEGNVITSLNTQLALFAAPNEAKMQILAYIGGLTAADATAIKAATPTFAGYYLFPDAAVFGGSGSPCLQTIQKIGIFTGVATC